MPNIFMREIQLCLSCIWEPVWPHGVDVQNLFNDVIYGVSKNPEGQALAGAVNRELSLLWRSNVYRWFDPQYADHCGDISNPAKNAQDYSQCDQGPGP